MITRALIAGASIGTFSLLVIAMAPAHPTTDPSSVNDATVPTTTAPAVLAPGGTATTVLTVGDIGELSASLHQRSAPANPSTTGR